MTLLRRVAILPQTAMRSNSKPLLVSPKSLRARKVLSVRVPSNICSQNPFGVEQAIPKTVETVAREIERENLT
jgi:hypothetical protein